MKLTTLAMALTTLAAPAFAESHMAATDTAMAAPTGDAAAGEEQFNKQCVACHVVQDPATDEVLAGRNAKVGPNLYGVAGRVAGTHEGFNYGDSIKAYGETGAVWDEANFVAYVQDPTGFLRTALDDKRARGKMAYQVRDEAQAHDLYAFLATFGTEGMPADGEAPAATN
ncbi:c-type cytochrome [Loktanella sp. M215]|uniref:c-type cytochrome n=1 Tax=Loktanella sp. M215 TaxID=2675431 RepID=UPI001F01FB2C|nr:c-type cytochrome [Loktanella sp. M215]MCF7698399.1 c-type cytochrome [Loktanella sp. M215]